MKDSISLLLFGSVTIDAVGVKKLVNLRVELSKLRFTKSR